MFMYSKSKRNQKWGKKQVINNPEEGASNPTDLERDLFNKLMDSLDQLHKSTTRGSDGHIYENFHDSVTAVVSYLNDKTNESKWLKRELLNLEVTTGVTTLNQAICNIILNNELNPMIKARAYFDGKELFSALGIEPTVKMADEKAMADQLERFAESEIARLPGLINSIYNDKMFDQGTVCCTTYKENYPNTPSTENIRELTTLLGNLFYSAQGLNKLKSILGEEYQGYENFIKEAKKTMNDPSLMKKFNAVYRAIVFFDYYGNQPLIPVSDEKCKLRSKLTLYGQALFHARYSSNFIENKNYFDKRAKEEHPGIRGGLLNPFIDNPNYNAGNNRQTLGLNSMYFDEFSVCNLPCAAATLLCGPVLLGSWVAGLLSCAIPISICVCGDNMSSICNPSGSMFSREINNSYFITNKGKAEVEKLRPPAQQNMN